MHWIFFNGSSKANNRIRQKQSCACSWPSWEPFLKPCSGALVRPASLRAGRSGRARGAGGGRRPESEARQEAQAEGANPTMQGAIDLGQVALPRTQVSAAGLAQHLEGGLRVVGVVCVGVGARA